MSEIQAYKLNHGTIKVICEYEIAMELSECFSFQVPGAKFSPAYRMGRWDGYIRLFALGSKTLPSGLYPEMVKIAESRGHTVTPISNPKTDEYGFPGDELPISLEEVREYMHGLNVRGGGEEIEIRDYQVLGVHTALQKKQGILLACTGSGKSLMIYGIARYLTEEMGKRILVVVPTVGLTTQFQGDFKDYSSANGYDVDANVHLISGGTEKDTSKPVVFTTYQSLKNMTPEWFNSFDCIIADEGHTITSTSFKSIFGKATEVPWRLACTGTLHELKCNILEMNALTGPVYEIALAKDLIAAGQLVPLKVKAIQLNYSDEICAAFKKQPYDAELDWIVKNPRRNNFIAKLAKQCKGTTLVMFRFTEQGRYVYDKIKELVGDTRPVYFIDGGVSKEDRESARLAANQDDVIVVASAGTTKAGVNIPGIENIIDGHPWKSKITFLQAESSTNSLKKGKAHCNLFTIGDNMTYKKKPNITFTHFGVRMQLLAEEGHQFEIVPVNFS
jgi:superfamily II DNA or RNA helicase